MTPIIIRNLDKEMEQKLRIRAAENNRSMEEEVREILRSTLDATSSLEKNLGTKIHQMFMAVGGVELDIPPRQPMREPPRFD